MRETTLCIAASVLLCLVTSPVGARQLRQETNAAAPVGDGTAAAAAVSPSPPATTTTEPTATTPATTEPSASPSAATALTAPDNAAAGSNAGSTGGSTTNNATAVFPSLMDAVEAANTTAAGNMSILMSALEASGVGSAIPNDTAWTILAPNNAAFEKTLAALNLTAQELLANQSLLTTILSYHVIPAGALNSSSLTTGASVATALPGANLTVDIMNMTGTPNVTFVGDSNSASVLVPDIIAGNSTIHVIDNVLLPPANATAPAAGGGAAAGTPDTNASSPQPAEAAAASPPPVDTTGATDAGAAGTTGAASAGANGATNATAGTTSAGNTGTTP